MVGSVNLNVMRLLRICVPKQMQIFDIANFERQLAVLLDDASAATRINQISVSDVRNWTAGYLREHTDEIARFPELVDSPHWTLFARDLPGEDAVFAIVTFTPREFGVIAGRGQRATVHTFEPDNDDISTILHAAQDAFSHTSSILTMPLPQAYAWIECGQ